MIWSSCPISISIESLAVDYYRSAMGANCPINDIVTKEFSCKRAATILGLEYVGRTQDKDKYQRPLGCYFDSKWTYFNSYVNTDDYGIQPSFGLRGGICTSLGTACN